MLEFSKYTQLNEAVFSLSSIFMVVRKIEKVLTRRLGRLYRYDGDNGYVDLQNSRGKAVGFLYFLANGRAFQLNYMKPKGESRAVFATVNIWRKFKTDTQADFTIKLNGLNIVQVINQICDVIKNPSPGEIPVTIGESVDNEQEELSEMARRRVDLSTFAQMTMKLYGRVTGLSWQDIQNVADANNVQVPGVVRGMKSGRGKWHVVPQSAGDPHEGPASDHDDDVGTDPDTGLAKKSSLVVIGKGPDGRWFKPKEEEVVKALNIEVRKMIGGPPTKTELKDPNTLFGHMVKLVQMVARGTNPALLIYGGPGVGKTFSVTSTLESEGLSKGSGYYMIKGKTSPMGLYRTLFQLRNDLIVFDDSDSIFSTEDSRNILKAALDSYDTRIVSWQSSQTIPVGKMAPAERDAFMDAVDTELNSGAEKVKLPSEFEFTGKVIFISNLPADKIEPAILSRSFKIDMTITPDAIFNRIESIIGEVGDKSVSVDDKKEILNHLRKMHALGNLEQPNMRTFVSACAIKKSGVSDWESLIQYT